MNWKKQRVRRQKFRMSSEWERMLEMKRVMDKERETYLKQLKVKRGRYKCEY